MILMSIYLISHLVFNCEVEINVLNPKVAKNHPRINSVDGKHNLLSINHISSDLEDHQVQDGAFKFGTIYSDLAFFSSTEVI